MKRYIFTIILLLTLGCSSNESPRTQAALLAVKGKYGHAIDILDKNYKRSGGCIDKIALLSMRGDVNRLAGNFQAAEHDFLSAANLCNLSTEDQAFLVLSAFLVRKAPDLALEAQNLLSDMSSSTEDRIQKARAARLQGFIYYLAGDPSHNAIDFFRESVTKTLGPKDLVRPQNSQFAGVLVVMNQDGYIEWARNEISKTERARLRSMTTAADQAFYIEDRKETSMGTFGLPSDYLEASLRVYYALRDIIVTHEEREYEDVFILGTEVTESVYAGRIQKGDAVYVTKDGYVRTLHSDTDLLGAIRYPTSQWHKKFNGNEVYGDVAPFMKSEGLTQSSTLFGLKPIQVRPTSFVPTRFVKKSSSWSGGLLGFVSEHPIASLLIGAAIVGIASDQSNSSTSGSPSASPRRGGSSASGIKQPYVGAWSDWFHHSPLAGGQHREAWIRCASGLSFEAEEHERNGAHWFQRDSGAVLLPKKYRSFQEFIAGECGAGSGLYDHDRQMQQ